MMRYALYDYSKLGSVESQGSDSEVLDAGQGAVVIKFAGSERQKSLLILDRDDTLLIDSGYMFGEDKVLVNSDLVKILQKINKSKIAIGIATNQSGIGRGLFELKDCLKFNLRMFNHLLDAYAIELSLIAICPHSPFDNCLCRKPRPELLKLCMRLTSTQPLSTIFVGNSTSDFDAGLLASIDTFNVNDPLHLKYVAEWIEKQNDSD